MNITKITSENFPALYAAYARRLRHYFYRRGIPVSDIDDCCQDAWLTAWNYRSKFNRAKGNVRGYIFLQARAALSWYWRRHDSQLKNIGRAVPIAEDDLPIDDLLAGHESPAHIPTQDERGWPWPPPKPRTHCKRGHPQTPENILTNRYQRKCKPCHEMRKAHLKRSRVLSPLLGSRLI